MSSPELAAMALEGNELLRQSIGHLGTVSTECGEGIALSNTLRQQAEGMVANVQALGSHFTRAQAAEAAALSMANDAHNLFTNAQLFASRIGDVRDVYSQCGNGVEQLKKVNLTFTTPEYGDRIERVVSGIAALVELADLLGAPLSNVVQGNTNSTVNFVTTVNTLDTYASRL